MSRRARAAFVIAALVWGAAAVSSAATYQLTSTQMFWTEAEAEANSLGWHLVAINSAEEAALLIDLFGGTEPLWIGLTDREIEGIFLWTNGDPLTYTAWAPGEPNNENNEDYGITNDFRGPGLWNDGHADTRLFRGIIEIVPEPATALLLLAGGLGGLALRAR